MPDGPAVFFVCRRSVLDWSVVRTEELSHQRFAPAAATKNSQARPTCPFYFTSIDLKTLGQNEALLSYFQRGHFGPQHGLKSCQPEEEVAKSTRLIPPRRGLSVIGSVERPIPSLVKAQGNMRLFKTVKQTNREVIMNRFQSWLFCIPLMGMAVSTAIAEEVWSLDGFNTPESVLYDAKRNVLYVTNIAGEATAKDGVGYLSQVSPDGKLKTAEWVKGFDAPKGLVMKGDTLFVSDIDRLRAVDVESGQITGTWAAEGAQFLNDTAVDEAGRVFVSDMLTNRIYVLENDALSIWLESEELLHPNGMRVEDGRLLVVGWGRDIQPDFSSKEPGHMIAVDLKTKAISDVGPGEPVGNLDGLEPDGAGNWLVTDWVAGTLFRIRPDGKVDQLMDLDQGSADLEFMENEKLVIIPMMMDGKLIATRVD
jgi:sugar lactone lactonase YvrE